jgi:hypothetical protein
MSQSGYIFGIRQRFLRISKVGFGVFLAHSSCKVLQCLGAGLFHSGIAFPAAFCQAGDWRGKALLNVEFVMTTFPSRFRKCGDLILNYQEERARVKLWQVGRVSGLAPLQCP